MSRWRVARDGGNSLIEEEQAELQSLIEEELNAARRRAEVNNDKIVRARHVRLTGDS